MEFDGEIFSSEVKAKLESLPEALLVLWYFQGTYRAVLCSDRFCSMIGVSREQIGCLTHDERETFVHEEDRELLEDCLQKALEDLSKPVPFRFRMQKGQRGQYGRVRGEIAGRRTAKNQTLIYFRCDDVTEDFEKIENLERHEKEREAIFHRVLDTTNDCIFWKDSERRFVGVNQAFLDFYGFESQDVLIGKTDEDMNWHPDPVPFREDEERVLQGHGTNMVHGTCIIRGEERDILATKAPVYDGDKVIGLVGSFIDVTEDYRRRREIEQLDKNLQKALKKEQEALEKERSANKSISYLMSRVSHELRTPMNAIIGLSMLGMDQDSLEKSKEYLRKINTSGQYLLGIVNDVLDINKIEDGKFKLNDEVTSISDLLAATETIIRPIAEMKEIHFVIDQSEVTEPTIVCDNMRLQQILINILNNAVKFTDAGGEVRCTVTQVVCNGKADTKFIIKDNGCGMSEEFMKEIFKPFAQENRNPSKYGNGTGLGLTLSRTIARIMGGDIEVVSEEGKGSTFTVTSSFDVSHRKEIGKKVSQNAVSGSTRILNGRRILLVEDNEINAEVAGGLLERVGIEIDWACNGAVAVEQFCSKKEDFYDVILMDVQMPVMDGYEACRRIRALPENRGKNIPIIAMSADIFDVTVKRAKESGMNDFVTKPVYMEALYSALVKAIRGKENENTEQE